MVPALFVELDKMPLTGNGKIDRRALPEPDHSRPELSAEYVAPQAEKEQILADIWQKILNIEEIGIHDNFFELGGDSILSIQIISRAGQAGLKLTPKQIFQNPTIASLAEVAESAPMVHAEQGIVTGELPLTPIQRWFFDNTALFVQPNHWNQAIILNVHETLDEERLRTTIGHLLAQHDALRMRFTRDPDDEGWHQENRPLPDDIPLEVFDLTDRFWNGSGPGSLIEEVANRIQSSLDIENGPLMRVGYLKFGPKEIDKLIIAIHHLVIDGLSWRILLEDLEGIYAALMAGQPLNLPPKTTAFRDWAHHLASFGAKEGLSDELEYWSNIIQKGSAKLPLTSNGGAEVNEINKEASAAKVSRSLSVDDTEALLRQVPLTYNTEINEILLSALTLSLKDCTGYGNWSILLEGHGREDLFEEMNISRTIGWFTTQFPVHLNVENGRDFETLIKTTKESIRQIPNRGFGYGILSKLHPDASIRSRLQPGGRAEISFNYLGQFDQTGDRSGRFSLANDQVGHSRHPQNSRTEILEISGTISNGRLNMEWIYSQDLHTEEKIEKFADTYMESLKILIQHCLDPETEGGYTVSDFSESGLDQDELDAVLSELEDFDF